MKNNDKYQIMCEILLANYPVKSIYNHKYLFAEKDVKHYFYQSQS